MDEAEENALFKVWYYNFPARLAEFLISCLILNLASSWPGKHYWKPLLVFDIFHFHYFPTDKFKELFVQPPLFCLGGIKAILNWIGNILFLKQAVQEECTQDKVVQA